MRSEAFIVYNNLILLLSKVGLFHLLLKDPKHPCVFVPFQQPCIVASFYMN